ncbi:uncharacterized protein J3R85_018850 [Psidium guajava]|nr:uncharacterized protein J3R85_018850 [Psidium guajava]
MKTRHDPESVVSCLLAEQQGHPESVTGLLIRTSQRSVNSLSSILSCCTKLQRPDLLVSCHVGCVAASAPIPPSFASTAACSSPISNFPPSAPGHKERIGVYVYGSHPTVPNLLGMRNSLLASSVLCLISCSGTQEALPAGGTT